MKILVVEDDTDIRELICQSLKQAEYHLQSCADVKTGRQLIVESNPDCLIVDWMLPDSSGVKLIRWLRRQQAFHHIPVLMLTARSQETDKITGLDAGADDYMTKPMSLRELHARVKALLRRPAAYVEASDELVAGSIVMNTRRHEISVDNQVIDMTRTEFKLLRFFMQNRQMVFSRDQLLSAVWGENAYLGDRTVDVHIMRLRKTLKIYGLDDMIVTVHGAGYRFVAN